MKLETMKKKLHNEIFNEYFRYQNPFFSKYFIDKKKIIKNIKKRNT